MTYPLFLTRVKDTSGFEHVFVGETDSYKISGFHNWVQFYLEEKKNALTYKGYKGSMKVIPASLIHFVTFSRSSPNVEIMLDWSKC